MAVREDSTYYSGGGGLLGGSGAADTNCVLVEMGPDGSNEQVLMELGREVTPRINVSPLGTYFALHENQSKVIRIYRRGDMGLVKEMDFGETVNAYDWGPDEDVMAVHLNSGVFIYTILGTRVRQLTNFSTINAWKYGVNILGIRRPPPPPPTGGGGC
jgi:hypothetical protein